LRVVREERDSRSGRRYGLANVVLVDEQAVYTPCVHNDRLLLGLKGTMTDTEPAQSPPLRTSSSTDRSDRDYVSGGDCPGSVPAPNRIAPERLRALALREMRARGLVGG